MTRARTFLNRRDLFMTAMTAGAASVLVAQPVQADELVEAEDRGFEELTPQVPIVDTNVNLFQWPFRRLPLDDTDALVAKLRSLGVAQAWAGSFEGILHRDLAGVNRRLAETCGRHPELVPIGSVNPELPDWQDDFRRCTEEHQMPGVRLHPNYHGYTLKDPRFAQLLERATRAGRFVQIAAAMEDARTQHPMMRAPDVDLSPLPDLVRAMSGARVQVLNVRPRSPLLERLAETPGIRFDTSRVEGTDGIAQLLQLVPVDRVMFGSHAPFLVPEAALIRIHESNLDDETVRSLLAANAQPLEDRRN